MNAVEIEEAISALVSEPFNSVEFPFQFIAAFGAKKATVDRLRKGDTNQSDVGGLLQRSNIHIGIAPRGEVGIVLTALRGSYKTASAKAKFILATDGETVEAEDLVNGDVVACPWADLPRHFGTFLPLAGISAVSEIKNNPIDVKATGRLNKLYVELLKDNPGWATEERRHELNQFMARLIFCFFAEDTGIFRENQFTATITQMSHAGHGTGDEQWGNTHEVLTELFRAMDTPVTHAGNLDNRHRRAAAIRPYADVFPYVNGGLFTGATACPRFSRTARVYMLRAGELDWKEINPDIFGSMIQAVANDSERGELGMHYTSVPNILKVLNPLFLDDLRDQLMAAGDSKQKLRNLRRRLMGIRVFDPACGSGNFLVIAYKEMRAIEADIVARLGGEANLKLEDRRTVISLSNFYGIEIKDFAAEIARLALLIAEFQADCIYLSQQEARAMVLPLHKTGQITVGNALRVDWSEVCPPLPATDGTDCRHVDERLASEESGVNIISDAETYICGNPPYRGSQWQTEEQKADLRSAFEGISASPGSLDYVSGWFMAARNYLRQTQGSFAFVTTNSISQGRQVEGLWPVILTSAVAISFAHRNIKWANLASDKAGVTVNIIGVSNLRRTECYLFNDGIRHAVGAISPYLVSGEVRIVGSRSSPSDQLSPMSFGNMPNDGGALLLGADEARDAVVEHGVGAHFIRRFLGSQELVQGQERRCVWVTKDTLPEAKRIPWLADRFRMVQQARAGSSRGTTSALAEVPWRFGEVRQSGAEHSIVVPRVSSENRAYLPVGIAKSGTIIGDRNFALYGASLWNLALVASRLHWVWIGTVCARMRTDFSYSNTLGWNTFPVPRLTDQDKVDLTRTAENILLAREVHFPATIADLYAPEAMPDDLRRAHEENDMVLERIYIGRRFRNDTERLEKLFDLYAKMTANARIPKKGKKAA